MANQDGTSVEADSIPRLVHKRQIHNLNARHRDDMKVLRQHYVHTQRLEKRKIERLNITVGELEREISEQKKRLLDALEAQSDLYHLYGSRA